MLKGSRFFVLASLKQLLAQTPCPSIFDIAAHADYEPETVRSALKDLEAQGLIVRKRDTSRQGRPYRYQVIS